MAYIGHRIGKNAYLVTTAVVMQFLVPQMPVILHCSSHLLSVSTTVIRDDTALPASSSRGQALSEVQSWKRTDKEQYKVSAIRGWAIRS